MANHNIEGGYNISKIVNWNDAKMQDLEIRMNGVIFFVRNYYEKILKID